MLKNGTRVQVMGESKAHYAPTGAFGVIKGYSEHMKSYAVELDYTIPQGHICLDAYADTYTGGYCLPGHGQWIDEADLRVFNTGWPVPPVEDEPEQSPPGCMDKPTSKLGGEETKPTNPKDAIGSDKLPLHLFPGTAVVAGC